MRLHGWHQKTTLSIFSDAISTGRPQTSVHGKLFGGDSLCEVLATLAANRAKRFAVLRVEDDEVVALAEAIDRTVTQTRREVRKLEAIGVIEEVERRRKTVVYAVADSDVAERTLALPDALVARLGEYPR
jgi:predicted transcriptional regulator